MEKPGSFTPPFPLERSRVEVKVKNEKKGDRNGTETESILRGSPSFIQKPNHYTKKFNLKIIEKPFKKNIIQKNKIIIQTKEYFRSTTLTLSLYF